MAKFEIITKMFDDPKTGNAVPYDRFVVSGLVVGKMRTVELKLDKNQLEMISMIMDSDEDKLDTITRKATQDEKPEITKEIDDDSEFEL